MKKIYLLLFVLSFLLSCCSDTLCIIEYETVAKVDVGGTIKEYRTVYIDTVTAGGSVNLSPYVVVRKSDSEASGNNYILMIGKWYNGGRDFTRIKNVFTSRDEIQVISFREIELTE